LISRPAPDLGQLLEQLNPQAPLAERHLWLIALCDWIRSNDATPETAASRVQLLLDALDARPELRQRLQAWWTLLLQTVDATTLLADFGFAPRTAFVSELAERLRHKLLPDSPETLDAVELFALALPAAGDADWLQALPPAQTERLRQLLHLPPEAGDLASPWEHILLDAITYCAGQMLSTGYAPELRLRMSDAARQARPFHALMHDVEALRAQLLQPVRQPEAIEAALLQLRSRLDACRQAAASVYGHLDENGISVGLVFRLRQLRERVLRIRELLDCLLSDNPSASTVRLLARLVQVEQERTSIRALLTSNFSLLAAKVAERSAETGEHYITCNRSDYFAMVRMAAGGGLVMAFTTLAKFGLYALALSAFWAGFAAGLNYALSFVLIQLLHFTVATKQPAMTAPAMAAKLKDLGDAQAIEGFVDKVAQLVRTQVAAVLGNVLVVLPAAALLAWLLGVWRAQPVLDQAHALQTLRSLSLWGPSLLFAAFTGVLLFASSILAGWTENWFVLSRLDSALRYNPRITAWLGRARAARWAQWLREHISGLAANISLGLLLGLTPAIASFFGLGLEVRHVTLSTGQIGVALAGLGSAALSLPALWWAAAMVPLNGAINVGVSFYLAFQLALRAHNVSGVQRAQLYAAIRQRLRQQPWSFLWPSRADAASASTA
jgi:site-specific recombinase